MPQLREVYANKETTDDAILNGVLDCIFTESIEDHQVIYNTILYYTDCLEKCFDIDVERPAIKYVVELVKSKSIESVTINDIVEIVKEHIKNIKNSLSLYIICYYKSMWQIKFEHRIVYNSPEYAVKESYGMDPWIVFVSSVPDRDFVLF